MLNINYQPTILIVDDNPENLDIPTIVPDKLNAKLVCAISGADALAKIDGAELALAIIDMRMPDMTGYELALKLNDGRANNKVPVIFLIADHFDPEEVLKGYSSGAVDYIIKPFSKQILLSKVTVFLDLFNQKQIISRNAEQLKETLEKLTKVNEKLTAHEQKQEREYLYSKALLKSIPGIYYLCTYPELKLVDWNEQCESILGYDASDMKGSSIFDLLLFESKELIMKEICSISEHSQTVIEASLKTKDGRIIPFLHSSVKFESEGRQYLIGIGTNISERIQAEQALRDSEWTLTKAQQIAHVGSWEYDYQTDQMKCSDETFRIFGFQPGEVKPSLKLFYDMVHPEDYQSLMESIEDVKNKHIPLSIDLRILYSNGDQGFIHEQAEMTFDSDGVPAKWIGTVHDITQRKKTEEELQKSLEQLHQLSKHVEQARENERLNIARELHDDLGQALTAVKIDLEIIKQNTSDSIAKEKLQDVKVLVGDAIRTVQRITSQLRPEIIDNLGLEAAISWYTEEFSLRYGIEVFLDIENGIAISNDDALPLFRIMQESLTNIARHADATEIEIVLRKQGDFIHFEVRDNGVGITEAEVNSKKSFGIMSMKERTASLGGTFSISRRVKFGSKIVISFPINKG
ncbi:PAS domain S-box protein [Maribellus luteus]|uniref:histidine kinase n=1 Tax=Maribellus luteus TaxID=2305463 RepID=A0A399SYG4_9BACT|nr:PAS domain-containing protein [Maribellus luteus]RIJ47171.1 PAS domain S-box protein [Maribellus luteus]